MKKKAYRAKNIKHFSIEKISQKLAHGKFIAAIDVAKHDFAVGIAQADGTIVEHFRFTHPKESMMFLDIMQQLKERGHLAEVVMEPTGTYGDALREQLVERGMAIFSVSPKRCHDAAEIFDGVPSLHDVKATAILARLHAQGLSKAWEIESPERRALRAAIERRELYSDPLERDYGRLEALLSRWWPERGDYLPLRKQKTLLALLTKYPGPQSIATDVAGAFEVMKGFSRGHLSTETIEALLASSLSTLGAKMTVQDQQYLQELCQQMLYLWNEVERVDQEIGAMVEQDADARALVPTVGKVTAAVLVALLGTGVAYSSAGAYLKAMGLNLKEHSSGSSKQPGTGLHITKRGPGLVRRYLYLATLRLIQRDPVCRAWYEKRKAYERGEKVKAVVALMRKLAKALWHVSRGEAFDVEKLFDMRRLRGCPGIVEQAA